MKNTLRRSIWTTVGTLILLVFLISPFLREVQLNEAIAYSVILLFLGGMYELWQYVKVRTRTYRFAFLLGLLGAFLLAWVNGAVGIIGSEDNPANLLYGGVFVVGLIGSLLSRFKPQGMAYTLFAAAAIQFMVPVFALTIWPAEASWGGAGVIGVFIFNAVLALFFVGSGLLFGSAARQIL